MRLEERLDLRLALVNESKDFRIQALKRVLEHIKSGESELKRAMAAGAVSMADVVRAIRSQRCLRTPQRDFGHTYLEQIVGTAIRRTMPTAHINRVRELFGLDALSSGELASHAAQG